MDTNAKKGIEELVKLNQRDRETVYSMLEERGASHRAIDTIQAMVMIAGWFKKSTEIQKQMAE